MNEIQLSCSCGFEKLIGAFRDRSDRRLLKRSRSFSSARLGAEWVRRRLVWPGGCYARRITLPPARVAPLGCIDDFPRQLAAARLFCRPRPIRDYCLALDCAFRFSCDPRAPEQINCNPVQPLKTLLAGLCGISRYLLTFFLITVNDCCSTV